MDAKLNFKRADVIKLAFLIREFSQTEHTLNDFNMFLESNLKRTKAKTDKNNNNNAKLNENQVSEIKRMLYNGKNCHQIADKFKVSVSCIKNIKYNYTWRF